MKLLYLNAVSSVPSEAGEAKIERALEKHKKNNQGSVYRDEFGRSEEDYENLNVPLPEDFYKDLEEEIDDDAKIDENGNILLMPYEMEWTMNDYLMRLDFFVDAEDDEEIGCIITLTNGEKVHVEETAEQIFMYITMLNMSWWDKLKSSVSSFFAKIKNKLNKNSTNKQLT
jgi:hypothetical protein